MGAKEKKLKVRVAHGSVWVSERKDLKIRVAHGNIEGVGEEV